MSDKQTTEPVGWDDWRFQPKEEQPGETRTYAARRAGEHVMQAIAGLSPWAKRQVLRWALRKVGEHER